MIYVDPLYPVNRNYWGDKRNGKYTLQRNLCLAIPEGFEALESTWHPERAWIAGRGLCVMRGYRWDGSSVVLDVSACMIASLVHDVLCEMIDRSQCDYDRRHKMRVIADRLYADICRAQGMFGLRARARYIGLRLFGGLYSVIVKVLRTLKS